MDDLKTWMSVHGRVSELARACGVTPSAVHQWKKVPAEYVIRIEDMTGISRHELRPDVFGPSKSAEHA